MGHIRLILPFQRQAWYDVLFRCERFDVYHLPEYYLTVSTVEAGKPFLLAYEEENYVAALPVLIRPVDSVPELKGLGWCDATSAYGYPGLLTNCRPDAPKADEFRRRWQDALHQLLRSLHIVALFVREHPLVSATWMWHPMAIVKPLGQTVVLDLQRPEEEQLRAMRQNHRRNIRDAIKCGITVVEDESLERLGEFQRLYEATMLAVNAEPYYFFPQSYYEGLRHHLHGRVKLLFAVLDGEPVAGAIFFHCGNVLQYHLGGSNPALGRERAMGMKLIMDTVRRWGSANGFRWFHLGGGLGARQDSLFHFKAGFSDLRCDYHVVNYVVDQEAYGELVRRRFGDDSAASLTNGWFPAYRCPTVRRAA